MNNPVAPVSGHYALLRNGSVVHPECITKDFDLDGTPYYLSPNSDDDYYWTANGVCQRQAYPKGIPKLIFVPDHDIIATISPEAMKLAANPELIGDLIREAFDTSPEYKSLKGAVEKMLAENERLRASLQNIRALAAKRQHEGGPNGTLKAIEEFAVYGLEGKNP